MVKLLESILKILGYAEFITAILEYIKKELPKAEAGNLSAQQRVRKATVAMELRNKEYRKQTVAAMKKPKSK